MAIQEDTTNPTNIAERLDAFFPNNAPYLVHLDGQQICADPRDKGEPGDIVVVWPRKRGPRLARKLARHADGNSYWFADLADDQVVEIPNNKVTAVHKVVAS